MNNYRAYLKKNVFVAGMLRGTTSESILVLDHVVRGNNVLAIYVDKDNKIQLTSVTNLIYNNVR